MDFKAWKEKRKAKKYERKDPYDKEELRLLTRLNSLTMGTEEYKECQAELKNINAMRSESRESKRKISKQDRGSIVLKILGGVTGGLGLLAVIKAEKDGLTYTGEKRTIMDSICRGIGQVFVRR